MSSGEFLERYTITFLADDGIPLVLLKVSEDAQKACPFVTSEGCAIYPNRPWSCRMYPVSPTSSEEVEFLIEEIPSCLGFGEEREQTVGEWKHHQNIDLYDSMNRAYREITQHHFFQMGNKLDAGRAKLIYTACYDLDSFRKFLFQSRFFEKYDVEADLIDKMENDDEELLSFSYRWVKFALFSEDTLRLKDRDMDKLLQAQAKTPS
jgi:hypothetical protein